MSKSTKSFLTGTVIVLLAVGFFGYEYIGPMVFGLEHEAQAQEENTSNQPTSSKHTMSSSDASKDHGKKETSTEGHSAEQQQGHREIHLSSEQLKPLSIQVNEAEAGNARSSITRPATIKFNSNRIAQVGPRVSAKVEKVLVNLGDTVKKGQPIALLSSVELGKARAQYITAQARLETEQAAYKREQSLYEKDISSEAAMLEAKAKFKEAQANLRAAREKLRLYGVNEDNFEGIGETNQKPLSYFYVSSPVSGVLQKRDVVPGQTVGTNETPFHVVNTNTVWAMIDAYERDIDYLRPGQNVTLRARSIGGQTFTGTIDWVSDELDQQTRTLPVRATVRNKGKLLKSGMYVQTTIETSQAKKNALVPVDAVQTIDGKSMIFVPGKKEGQFRAVPVKTGDEGNETLEIISGIRPGDRIVTGGAFDLKSILTSKSRSASH
ncbi:MAG: efflux RND transporter periplasmic adaptor subunit [bacterium]